MLTIEMFRRIRKDFPGATVNKATALKEIRVMSSFGPHLVIEREEELLVSHHNGLLRAHYVSLDGKGHWYTLINDSAVTIKRNSK